MKSLHFGFSYVLHKVSTFPDRRFFMKRTENMKKTTSCFRSAEVSSSDSELKVSLDLCFMVLLLLGLSLRLLLQLLNSCAPFIKNTFLLHRGNVDDRESDLMSALESPCGSKGGGVKGAESCATPAAGFMVLLIQTSGGDELLVQVKHI